MKQQLLSKRWFVSLLLTLMSTISWAYDLEIDGMYYNLNSDEVSVSLTYKSMTEFVYTGDVVIPSSVKYRGRNYKVTVIGDDAFAGCEELTSVSIPNEVETIGSYAFAGCDGLTSITIPSGVKTIKAYAFNICENINSIVIPQNVQTIEDNAFSDCSALISVTVNSNAILSKTADSKNMNSIFGEQVKEYIIDDNVTSIGSNAFRNCSGLTSVIIGSRVKSIGESAFEGCSGLTSITIPESVTSIGDRAFSGCSGLTSINIPESVTSIKSSAFSGCSGLTSVTIPESVTSIGEWAFSGCSGLTSITIPESVTSIGGSAFSGCSGLTSITIPNSVTSIGGYAFARCSSLKSITIPNSVTSIGERAFMNCSGLTSVTINSNDLLANTDIDKRMILIFGEQVREYIIGNGVKSIGNFAFNRCSGLTSIIIGNGVTTIGNNAFSNCPSLTSVTINSNAILSKNYSWDNNLKNIFGEQVKEYVIGNDVTSIDGSAFMGCSGLTSITVASGNTKYDSRNNCNAIIETARHRLLIGCKGSTIPNTVTSIGGSAFRDCSGLTSITIPNSVTSIGWDAFCNCSGLTSITVASGNTKYDSRNNCNAIIETATNTLVVGCKETVIPNSVTSIGNYAFFRCSGLTSINIPNSVTSIGECAFNNCSGLTSVTIGNGVTSIGEFAFQSCSGLTSVTINSNAILSKNYSWDNNLKIIFGEQVKEYNIGNGVTSIDGSAFRGCSGLTSVIIGNSVKSIGWDAFRDCSGLKRAEFTSIESLCKISFVNVDSNPLSYAKHLYINGEEVKDVMIPNNVSSLNYTFCGCSALTSVTIPDGVTSIGDCTFCYCSGLKTINIPNSVTSIGNSAFWDCSGLTSITIPESVTSISYSAFAYCSGLTSVTCLAENVPNTDIYAFEYVPQSTATLYVPETSLNAYKTVGQWKEFGNIVGIDPTAVEELKSNKNLKANESAPIFDLMGRRLQQKPASGYYIQGGKKYFVK